MAIHHNPRCAIFDEPPSPRDAKDCNCGAIPSLVDEQREERKAQLIGDLLELRSSRDPEVAHVLADGLLLDFIGDARVSSAFNAVPKHYA